MQFQLKIGQIGKMMENKLKLTGDRVLLRVIHPESVTKGGLTIPVIAQALAQEGEVLVVGPGRRLKNGEHLTPEVKVGDRVHYPVRTGMDFTIDGVVFKIINESDIQFVYD